jgi:amino acid transporter
LYVGANVAYHLVLPRWEMTLMKETPVATVFALRLLGAGGAVVMSAVLMCSVFGALNGNLLVAPRLLYAMGEDGLAPRWLGAVHPRYHTPARAIVVMAGWTTVLVIAVGLLHGSKSVFDTLTDFAMFGAVIFETLAVATIFVFRRKMPTAERPYRCPGYPIVPALYLILPALVLGNMFVYQQLEAVVGLGFIAVGAVVYALVLRKERP